MKKATWNFSKVRGVDSSAFLYRWQEFEHKGPLIRHTWEAFVHKFAELKSLSMLVGCM